MDGNSNNILKMLPFFLYFNNNLNTKIYLSFINSSFQCYKVERKLYIFFMTHIVVLTHQLSKYAPSDYKYVYMTLKNPIRIKNLIHIES